MEVKFTLQLPRDALSVPVVRSVLDSAMRTLGVTDECLSDIEVALTEACTNVLDHAVQGDEYEVVAGLNNEACIIDVVDTGHGFDGEQFGLAEADPSSEEGRGIQLIRALVDRVKFHSRPHDGTIVRLEKQLQFVDGAVLQRLASRGPEGAAQDMRDAEAALREREVVLDT